MQFVIPVGIIVGRPPAGIMLTVAAKFMAVEVDDGSNINEILPEQTAVPRLCRLCRLCQCIGTDHSIPTNLCTSGAISSHGCQRTPGVNLRSTGKVAIKVFGKQEKTSYCMDYQVSQLRG